MKTYNFKKNSRFIVGVFLVLLGVGGFIFWEIEGREALLMDSVVMATADITPGVEIKKEFLTMGKVLKENRIQGSFDGAQLDSLIGQTSNQLILKNGQISTVYFKGKDLTLKKKESIFVIKAEWIYMVSS
ncbi:MAG: hypothetical protein RRY25_06115, partial [Anaerovorax sp.]